MATELSPAPSIVELLRGDDCLSVRNGRLVLEEVDLEALAKRYGTPLYVISEDQLRHNVRSFTAAFSRHWPEGEVMILPSIKANLSIALRHVLSEEGAGCDTFGAGELEAALRAGAEPESISLNGSTKDPDLIERAVACGARVTLDSLAELESARRAARKLGTTAQIRLRVRPWLELDAGSDFHQGDLSIAIATQRYKPGIPTEQLFSLDPDELAGPELNLRGLMAHIGRQGADPRIWAELASWIAALTGRLGEAWGGWRPQEIDLGGGFPIPRDPFGRGAARRGAPALAPAIETYAAAVTSSLRDGLREAGVHPGGIRLEIEPGRAIYGNAGLHLARVLHVKRQSEPVARTWVETDTSEIFLADLHFEGNRWQTVVAGRADQSPTQVADVVGISCNLDVIVPDAELPEVERGDLIAFLDTGAYQEANASNFNAIPRPATVLVHGDQAETIKRADMRSDVFARDRVPPRLAASPQPVIGLDHVSVACAELDRSIRFYRDLLGIPLRDRGEARGGEVAEIIGTPNAHIRWADLELGRGQVLELIQYLDPPQRTGGAGHISLQVDDAAEAHRALRDAGVEVRSEPVELSESGPWAGCRCFYASDPDGLTVELIERPQRASG